MQHEQDGFGLASLFDYLQGKDVQAFLDLQNQAKRLFPHLDKIQLKNLKNNQKELVFQLKNGKQVAAQLMSTGLILYLTFAALKYIEGTALWLIEEPENGLHPARIKEVVSIFREMTKTSQVIIATHSPFIVNELRAEEVSVVTRNENGTQVRPIKDTPNFSERAKVYTLGELWVSYANGEEEEPLFQTPDSPT